jgi:hypothetical protein
VPEGATFDMYTGSGISPLALSATAQDNLTEPREDEPITIELHRPFRTKSYVLLVLLIPFLLAYLLFAVLFQRASNRNTTEASHETSRLRMGVEALAGVATVLLATLPIRLVLVPADINELTIVDYALGLEMAILVCGAFIAVKLGPPPWKRASSSAAHQ